MTDSVNGNVIKTACSDHVNLSSSSAKRIKYHMELNVYRCVTINLKYFLCDKCCIVRYQSEFMVICFQDESVEVKKTPRQITI